MATVLSPPRAEVRELEERREQDSTGHTQSEPERQYHEDDESPWYLGKAKDEFRRRRSGQHGGVQEDEDDPIQVKYNHSY